MMPPGCWESAAARSTRACRRGYPEPIKWEGCTVWHLRDLENFVDQLADQVADQDECENGKYRENIMVTG